MYVVVVMAPLIFDCDPTIFYSYRDVDDSLALGYAIRKYVGEPNLIGVTTVFGNNAVDLTYRDALKVVEASGEDIPVFKGASSRNDLGKPNEAVEFMIEASREYGEIELLATGPLTNVATAYTMDDEFVDRVRRIVIMGGAVFVRGNVSKFDAEFNFWSDYVAASIVIKSFKNVVLVPLDITTKVSWTVETLELLRDSEDPLASFLYDAALPWAERCSSTGGFHPHDVVAAVYLLRDDLYFTRRIRITVNTKGYRKGKVLVDPQGREVLMLEDLEKEKFLEEYLSAFKCKLNKF